MAFTNEQIKKNIVDQFYWDNSVDASDVKIDIADGEVTLTGTVRSNAERQAAEADARVIPGVLFVRNELKVKYPESFEIPTDDEIQSNIVQILFWNPNIDSSNIEVDANRGLVTIEGSVDAFWKKIKAEELAYEIIGVIDVVNKLSVVPTQNVVDKAIADDLVANLDRNINIDPESVDVKVEDGKVALSGSVPNWNAWKTAQDAAIYTLGVKAVTNNLIISAE